MARVTISGDQSFYDDMEGGGKHQMSSAQTSDAAPGTLIQSGRTEGGSIRGAAQLTDKDIISVGGGETSVAAAINARLVSRNPDGSLEVLDPSVSASPSDEGPAEAPLEAMDRETESLITQAAESGEDLAVAAIVADVSKGVDASDNDLGMIASRLGMEPEVVRQNYETVRDQFTKQASDRVSKDTGLPAEAIFDWAWQHKPDLMQKAIQSHLNDRSTNGYNKVAREYILNLDQSDPEGLMEALRRNGFKNVEKNSKGKILFDDGSGQTEYRSAVLGGVIFPAGF